MDAFQMGLMTLAGAQNPDMLASLMAASGTPPPTLAGQPTTKMPFDASALGGLLQPQAPASAPAAPAGDPQTMMAQGLGALRGVKAPEAPKPIFNAGVSNSQNAPQQTRAAGGSQAIDALMQMALRPPAPSPIPSLGALLKGVG